MSAPADRLAREHPETDRYLRVYVVPFPLYLVGSNVRLTLSPFQSAVVLVLLIACANVAKLFFSRTSVRHESPCHPIALGASRAQVLRQVLAKRSWWLRQQPWLGSDWRR
jgi:putative ABC transport system permease protein